MDLNGYFDPVSLERPAFNFLPEEHSLSRSIAIHTPDQPIKNPENYNLAIIGIPEDKMGYIKGSAPAPDKIRGMLYQLREITNSVSVYDLGNLKIGENINDTYYAIRDIILDLNENDVSVLLIGGSQDLSFGAIMALEKQEGIKQILTVDPRFDFWPGENKEINSRNYLNYIFNKDLKNKYLYSNLGHQIYFTTQSQFDALEAENMESMRLGEIRDNIQHTEPLIRDADFVSIDMNAIKHSDAPGVTTPSPNGLFGDELCAILRYAGMSEKVKITGIFESSPSKDLNQQTSHLAAQAIWYFIEGYGHRVAENPVLTQEHSTKYIVTLDEIDHELVFHKSKLSERWWVEIPEKNPVSNHNFFISCSYEDYQDACNNILPERWWRYFKRLSK